MRSRGAGLRGTGDDSTGTMFASTDDKVALRELAEAVEVALRGGSGEGGRGQDKYRCVSGQWERGCVGKQAGVCRSTSGPELVLVTIYVGKSDLLRVRMGWVVGAWALQVGSTHRANVIDIHILCRKIAKTMCKCYDGWWEPVQL